MQKYNPSNFKSFFEWGGQKVCIGVQAYSHKQTFSGAVKVKVTFAETSIVALTEHIVYCSLL